MLATGKIEGIFFSMGTTPETSDFNFDCAHAVVTLFNNAKRTAHVTVYSITEPTIVDSMIAAHQRGVEVIVLVDDHEDKVKNEIVQLNRLKAAGVQVLPTTRQHNLMHNKVGIFDGVVVCIGSFNWTSHAERGNDENLAVLSGVEVAADYEKYVFQRILKNETVQSAGSKVVLPDWAGTVINNAS